MSVMSALKQTSETVANDELSLRNFVAVNNLTDTFSQKWTYLISNKVRFSSPVERVIHVHHYDDSDQMALLERVVCAGQCGILMVDNYEANDKAWERIKNLCERHGVVLVALSELSSDKQVAFGPW